MDKKSLIVILVAVVLLCAGIYIAGLSPEYGFYYVPLVSAVATINAVFFEPGQKYFSIVHLGQHTFSIAHKWLLLLAIIAFMGGGMLISQNSRDSKGFVCISIGIFLISFMSGKKITQNQL